MDRMMAMMSDGGQTPAVRSAVPEAGKLVIAQVANILFYLGCVETCASR
jgi:hypothetical protein